MAAVVVAAAVEAVRPTFSCSDIARSPRSRHHRTRRQRCHHHAQLSRSRCTTVCQPVRAVKRSNAPSRERRPSVPMRTRSQRLLLLPSPLQLPHLQQRLGLRRPPQPLCARPPLSLPLQPRALPLHERPPLQQLQPGALPPLRPGSHFRPWVSARRVLSLSRASSRLRPPLFPCTVQYRLTVDAQLSQSHRTSLGSLVTGHWSLVTAH